MNWNMRAHFDEPLECARSFVAFVSARRSHITRLITIRYILYEHEGPSDMRLTRNPMAQTHRSIPAQRRLP